MFCSTCGKEIQQDSKFCFHCGATIGRETTLVTQINICPPPDSESALVSAKCTSCGAALQVDERKEAAICPYCGQPYIVRKAVQNMEIGNLQISNSVINVPGGSPENLCLRAVEYLQQGNLAMAEQYYNRALDIDAACAGARDGMNRIEEWRKNMIYAICFPDASSNPTVLLTRDTLWALYRAPEQDRCIDIRKVKNITIKGNNDRLSLTPTPGRVYLTGIPVDDAAWWSKTIQNAQKGKYPVLQEYPYPEEGDTEKLVEMVCKEFGSYNRGRAIVSLHSMSGLPVPEARDAVDQYLQSHRMDSEIWKANRRGAFDSIKSTCREGVNQITKGTKNARY